jgi:hypothetical protein
MVEWADCDVGSVVARYQDDDKQYIVHVADRWV